MELLILFWLGATHSEHECTTLKTQRNRRKEEREGHLVESVNNVCLKDQNGSDFFR